MTENGQHSADRRKAARLDHKVRTEVSLANYEARMVSTNISRKGMFLRPERDNQKLVPENSIVRLVFDDPMQRTPVLARVVWVSGDGMGLHFVDPDDDLLNRLINLQS